MRYQISVYNNGSTSPDIDVTFDGVDPIRTAFEVMRLFNLREASAVFVHDESLNTVGTFFNVVLPDTPHLGTTLAVSYDYNM